LWIDIIALQTFLNLTHYRTNHKMGTPVAASFLAHFLIYGKNALLCLPSPSVHPSVTSRFCQHENALSVTHCSEYGVIFFKFLISGSLGAGMRLQSTISNWVILVAMQLPTAIPVVLKILKVDFVRILMNIMFAMHLENSR
jgi:hypothetical protein